MATIKAKTRSSSRTRMGKSPAVKITMSVAKPTGRSSLVAGKKFARSKLVGKFPDVVHLPAPDGKRRLDEEQRRALLQSMVLA